MQQRSKETRRGILTSAARLFSRSGFDGASINDICSEAGISKGAFYHHFSSKQQLFLRLVDDWLEGIDSQLFGKIQADSVPESLGQMAKTLGFVFEQARGQLPMFLEFMVRASRDRAVWDAAIAPYRRYQAQFAHLLEKGVDEGSIRSDVDVQNASWALISLAVGILLQGAIDADMADWNEVARSGVRMMVDSMQWRYE